MLRFTDNQYRITSIQPPLDSTYCWGIRWDDYQPEIVADERFVGSLAWLPVDIEEQRNSQRPGAHETISVAPGTTPSGLITAIPEFS